MVKQRVSDGALQEGHIPTWQPFAGLIFFVWLEFLGRNVNNKSKKKRAVPRATRALDFQLE